MNMLEEFNRTSQINKKLLCDYCDEKEVLVDYSQELESLPPKYVGTCKNCGKESAWSEDYLKKLIL